MLLEVGVLEPGWSTHYCCARIPHASNSISTRSFVLGSRTIVVFGSCVDYYFVDFGAPVGVELLDIELAGVGAGLGLVDYFGNSGIAVGMALC